MMAFTMVQTKPCIVCHKTGNILLETEKWERYKAAREDLSLPSQHVQDVWPDMSAGMREQITSGTHSKCWDEMFGGDEDDEP